MQTETPPSQEFSNSYKKALLDLLLLFLTGSIFFYFSRKFDLYEQFHSWSQDHEFYEIDEILIVLALFAFLFGIFALRRWQDMRVEVSYREKAETVLRDSHKSLEFNVNMRTRELEALNRELINTIDDLKVSEHEKNRLEQQFLQAQKLESIGILASGVAHDFNNLLSAIIGYADLALLKTSGFSDVVREDVEKIRKAGLQASELTRQLLAFSRKQIFNLKILNINDIVVDLTNMTSRIIGETVILEVDTEPELWNIKADKTQVEQVLMNLVINARDAMPDGGKLTIKTKNETLDKGYADIHKGVKPGKYVLIAVSDTGHGMSAEVQDKIFDPFFTTKDIGKGTGLGLATVFGIVKQHHGNIWLYSEPGHGTTFKVYLPATDEECNGEVDTTEETTLGRNEKILVVDDDETIREFVAEILRYHKYSVKIASCGKDALSIVETEDEPFDLLLTDVIMPHMDGWKLGEKVRERTPSTKVLFMSGYDDQILSMEKVNADPFLSFMSKPLTATDLTKRIYEIFETNPV